MSKTYCTKTQRDIRGGGAMYVCTMFIQCTQNWLYVFLTVTFLLPGAQQMVQKESFYCLMGQVSHQSCPVLITTFQTWISVFFAIIYHVYNSRGLSKSYDVYKHHNMAYQTQWSHLVYLPKLDLCHRSHHSLLKC